MRNEHGDDRILLVMDVQQNISRMVVGSTGEKLQQTLFSYSETMLNQLESITDPYKVKYHDVLPRVLANAANMGKTETYLNDAVTYTTLSRITPTGDEGAEAIKLGLDRLQEYKKLDWFSAPANETDWERVAYLLDLVGTVTERIVYGSLFTEGANRNSRQSIPLRWSQSLSSNRYDFEDDLVVKHLMERPEDAGLVGDLIIERKTSKWEALEPLLMSNVQSLSSGTL